VIRVGIFFGGPSREREISFAGGKTAFEHLDKQLFQPVPVFVDGFGRFVLIRTEHMYASNIRDFFPGGSFSSSSLYVESFPELKTQRVLPEIGELIEPSRFAEFFDFAFLAMHGPDCEDGGIQGLLEWYRIPYSGPGLLGSSIGIDKILQNQMLATVVGQSKKTDLIRFEDWEQEALQPAIFERIKSTLGLPIVIKAPHQGSSIGVAIVKENDLDAFRRGVKQCFFVASLSPEYWDSLDEQGKIQWARAQANLESGVGYPLFVDGIEIHTPEDLVSQLQARFQDKASGQTLVSADFEPVVLCEEFIQGQEFSCGCIQRGDGEYVALPPTEVIKVEEVFDFNSKYKPGGTRKRIPVGTSLDNNLKIQDYVVKAARALGMCVCVRIDGFITEKGEVLLHDPNTVPGMSPASLIFKQLAEIGLNITQSLTYLIRQSLKARVGTAKDTVRLSALLARLDSSREKLKRVDKPVKSLVIEPTDLAYARAKKWYSALSAEGLVEGVVYLNRTDNSVVKLPVPLLFKDFIEDVLIALDTYTHPLINDTRIKCRDITEEYAGNVDFDLQVLVEAPSFAVALDNELD
jgi:D-alanine-D-alanine ligase